MQTESQNRLFTLKLLKVTVDEGGDETVFTLTKVFECYQQILQRPFLSLLSFMNCSHAASKVSHTGIMKCGTNTLPGLQAQLTLIQLCTTSKDSSFVVL